MPKTSTSQVPHDQGCIPDSTIPTKVKNDTKAKPEKKEENVFHITVPSCVKKIVITKEDGKQMAIDL